MPCQAGAGYTGAPLDCPPLNSPAHPVTAEPGTQRLQGQGEGQRGRQIILELDQLDERITALCAGTLAVAGDTCRLVCLPAAAWRAWLPGGVPGFLSSRWLRLEGGLIRLSVKELSQLYEYWCYWRCCG